MPKEIIINLPTSRLKIAAKCWGDEAALPVIALHGWLDNAATFDNLAPLLKNIYLICCDLPGHGMSDHQPPGMAYHFLDYITVLKEITLALDLKQVGLLGHSLGAIIVALYAGSFSESVSRCVFIDSLGPYSQAAADSPRRLAYSIEKILAIPEKKPAVYETFDEACKMRQVNSDLSLAEVKILASRGVAKVPKGYSWRYDRKLLWPSLLYLTEEQVDSFLQGITMPVCVITASQSIMPQVMLDERLQQLHNKSYHQVEGQHHVHLQNPQPVAKILNEYFKTRGC